MYLKRIEMQGFKSFADKIEVDFQDGITAVVGPNGSGKSNISDAIRWVLGEQSAKTLRGSKMEDIIFAGTQSRRPVGFAEVTLILDNKDGKLPVEYTEVSVTRRVFRSGESEYYMNKNSCRLKDIRELFMDTGVGKDGYSIIGQGKIDEILSGKSEDRRNLFEEAVGIVKHKSRKEDAKKKLEKTNDNLVRINDIITELEGQITPLEEQSKRAKKYQKLSEELKDLEINLFIREIDRLKEQVEHIESQKQLVEKQLKYNKEEKEKFQKKYNKIKEEIDNMDRKIDDITNKKYTTENYIEKNEGDLKLYNEKNNTLKKEIDRLEGEISNLNEKIIKIDEDSKEIKDHREELNSKIKILNNAVEEKNKKISDINREIESKERSIEDKKGDIIEILNKISDKRSKINSLNSFTENIDKRIYQIEKELNELNKNKEKNIKDINKNKEDIESVNKELKQLLRDKSNGVQNKREVENRFDSLSEEMSKLKGDIQGKISNYNLLKDMKEEYEGFYKSVKNTLKAVDRNPSLGKGVKGVVAELIQVDKKYEKAIEIALGSSLQNIVTETENDAKNIIEHLKKNKLGRVTFLPISSIKGRSLNNYEKKIINTNDKINVASNIINYDDTYNDIFKYLLGRVLIVDNLDMGVEVSKRCNHSLKIVTLDGDVINPGGSMTGGSYKSNRTSILSRERQIKELKKNINLLNNKLKSNEKDLISLKRDISDHSSSIENLESKINDYNVKLAKLENEQLQLSKEKEQINNSIGKYIKEEEQLKNENKDALKNIEKIKLELKKLEEENTSIQGNIDDTVKKFEKERNIRDEISNDISNIRVKLASSKQEMKSIINQAEMYDKDKNNLIGDIKLKKENISKNKNNLIVIDKKIKELGNNKEEFKVKLGEYKEILDKIKKDKKTYLETYNAEEIKLQNMNAKISDLERSMGTLDVKYARYNVQLDNYTNKLWDEYEMSYQMAIEHKRDIDSISKVQDKIRKIKSNIKSLGNINLDAIDEYERVEERFEFMSSQKDDLMEAKKSLNRVIKELEEKMQEQFIAGFKIIRSNFQEIFKKLFGGGKADVYLLDEENILTSGIQIVAQPPGKKLQNLSLLSGGEKALTAISLLFAILKTKPTPFCILDEIEAALDDANVYRYADYLKEFSNNTQFIVITHRKGTMEGADSLYGVTMEEQGVSRLISVKLTEELTEKVS
ncbi:chromosome segregation protein SMC [Dethiothermospora halolimnae]|uniref:chromosome segregation protein SMC n=1 Tax=Dethiothermospora halolimnae TaxID=3114390 RepID=UPI003CCC0A0B